MKYLAPLLLGLFTLGFTFIALSAQSESPTIHSSLITSEEVPIVITTPAQGVQVELDAAEKALAQGDYNNVIAHVDNIRFIVSNTKEVLPKELPAIETIARHMQVAGMVDDADDLYRRGAYNKAVEKFDQAISVMRVFGVKPSRKAFLLAKKIDSGLFEPIYILEETPFPKQLHI